MVTHQVSRSFAIGPAPDGRKAGIVIGSGRETCFTGQDTVAQLSVDEAKRFLEDLPDLIKRAEERNREPVIKGTCQHTGCDKPAKKAYQIFGHWTLFCGGVWGESCGEVKKEE